MLTILKNLVTFSKLKFNKKNICSHKHDFVFRESSILKRMSGKYLINIFSTSMRNFQIFLFCSASHQHWVTYENKLQYDSSTKSPQRDPQWGIFVNMKMKNEQGPNKTVICFWCTKKSSRRRTTKMSYLLHRVKGFLFIKKRPHWQSQAILFHCNATTNVNTCYF